MSIEDQDVASNAASEGGGNPAVSSHGPGTPTSASAEAHEEVEAQAWDALIDEINVDVFEELVLEQETATAVQNAWNEYIRAAESRETAGEAIYAAVFDAAPSLQSLFKTPRAVMAMRFMNGVNQIITAAGEPKALKVVVETLGFQHMDLDVTQPRVRVFRDAIVDLLALELGAQFSGRAQRGLQAMLNYAGGAYIFIRSRYTDRLRILASSWRIANNKTDESEAEDDQPAEDADETGKEDTKASSELKISGEMAQQEEGLDSGEQQVVAKKAVNVPTTYSEMFHFNAVVMGFKANGWMNEVLTSFDSIVTNVSNSYRLQEECEVLSLRIAKYKGEVKLGQYKAVMLASLRSLVREWGSDHEVSWSWLWENVERMIQALIGKPVQQERALERFLSALDDDQQDKIRREVFVQFFALAPSGQDYFKQSTTRLHFIADRVVNMTLELYKEPVRMVEDISALGLRHVGYDIPTEFFGPFVTACVEVIRRLTQDSLADEAFRWSLSLISRILVRVINEGSTIVMKAINANSGKGLKKAVSCAPRGKRAMWVLNVQVGTQSISPLLWAIETGSHEAAKAIIQDLLTIRADRDRYYYGMEALFERHENLIQCLCNDAPALLPTLLDGLIWRSRTTEHGQRRVNYYIRYLIADSENQFSKALSFVVASGDPTIICHPVLALVTDLTWSRLAFRIFLYGKTWFLFTLCVFITAQAVLKHVHNNGVTNQIQRTTMFGCRYFIYTCSLGQWIYFHVKHVYQDIRNGRIFRLSFLRIPEYLKNWQDVASLLLTILLILMYSIEPILFCLQHSEGSFVGNGLYTQTCPEAKSTRFAYSVFSMAAMILYYLLLMDMCVFSTRISAFVLVIFRVLSEVGLFLFALAFFLVGFACAVSSLEQNNEDFSGIPVSALSMLKITLGMFSGRHYDDLNKDAALMASVFGYIVVTVIFLVNMLVAQLNSAYQSTYQDMLGFARLNRGKIVMEAMPSVGTARWEGFLRGLRLEEKCEFGEGDVGLPGGVQVLEPGSLNVTTVDMIKRVGGSTSPAALWPVDLEGENDEIDRFDKIERNIDKAMKRLAKNSKSKGSSSDQKSSSSGGKGSSDGSMLGDQRSSG